MSNLTAINNNFGSVSLPPRHLYQPQEFANRDDALGVTSERMHESSNRRKIPQPVVIYWGVSGIGKSWVLNHLANQYRFPPQEPPPGPKYSFSTLVDFRDFSPSPDEWAQLLSTAVTQVTEQLGERIAPAAEALTAFQEVARAIRADTSTLDDLAERFTAFINALTDEFAPLLLFDSLEIFEEKEEYQDSLYWFEEQIVAPLVRYDRVLTIFASRRELRWRQFEVRRRTLRIALEAFSPEETEEQFKKAEIKDFALVGNVLYPYAFGHPYTAWHLQRRLNPLLAPEERFDQSFVAARHPEVATVLREVEEWLLKPVPSDLRNQLRLASAVRKFHINSLRLILDKLTDEAYLKRSDSVILDLIGRMVDTNLVRYSSAYQGYTVDRTVRRLLNLRLQLQEASEYRRRQTAALEIYEDWIDELPENCGSFLIEAVFHTAALARANDSSPEETWKKIEALLNKALQAEKFTLEGADFLVEELKRDNELQEILSEPPFEEGKLFDDLLKRAEGFKKKVRKFWDQIQ